MSGMKSECEWIPARIMTLLLWLSSHSAEARGIDFEIIYDGCKSRILRERMATGAHDHRVRGG
jgi:hypothetical protein